MKNCKKRNASFDSRIFSIALVTMLTATTLWAKPKNAVEYTPFKSENPNATVFECEYIKGYDEGLTLKGSFIALVDCSSIVVYGWKKKKGGWEKLGEYQPQPKENYFSARVLDDDSDKYTHYAVEFEVPENSLTFSTQGQRISNVFGFVDSCMVISFSISEDYEKLISEKRAAEEAERKRLEAEIKAKEKSERNAQINAIAKEIAKGYVYHGIEEDARNCKLFASKALEEGHAYCISDFVVKYGGRMAAIEYGNFLFSSQSSAVYVEYINQKVKGEIVEAGISTLFGTTIESPLTVVVVGGKAPLHTPIVIGLIE